MSLPNPTHSPFEDLEGREIESTLRLGMVAGLGPRLFGKLLDRFGSAENALAASPIELAEVAGIGQKLIREIVSASQMDIAAVVDECRQHEIRIIGRGQAEYPQPLEYIADPPPLLFSLGRWIPQDTVAIAIVGARHATHYGLVQAEKLARGLANAGFTIVSGLARGIDQAAHRGALGAGGRTIGVLASGVRNIYPPEHESLAREIQQQGAVLSEALPHHPPKSTSFPQRNRIVTGLCLGVIIVEAGRRSGALISARHASEQGREVFAVPGRVDSRMSQGCHRLIRDGAKLVENVDDVLEELGPLALPVKMVDRRTVHSPAELQLNDQETLVLQSIESHPTGMDVIVARSGLPIQRVLSTISVLEMRRLVRRISGNSVARV